MNNNIIFLFALIFLSVFFQGKAQTKKIELWPKGIPGEIKAESYKEENPNDRGCISKITTPKISVFLPTKEKANGTAVLICPGGGYSGVCIEHEGFEVAKWLNEQGIAAIVLKYRLPSDEIMQDKTIGPLQDAQEAMRIIRRNADAWGIKKDKIGVMGFSAGGHLASTLSTHYKEKVYSSDDISARPDFSILIYPVITFAKGLTHMGSRNNLIGEHPAEDQIIRFSNDLQITPETPATFLVHSSDDKVVPVQNSLKYYEGLIKNGVSAEAHIYEKGGHGYGLGRNPESSESGWPQACRTWLKAKGLL